MKVWYKAACDEHKEMCDVMVDSPYRTNLYLGKKNKDIFAWLRLHYNCSLRLIHSDAELDKCYKQKFINVELSQDQNED